jgi:uncharacterized protein (TIGR03067 family)
MKKVAVTGSAAFIVGLLIFVVARHPEGTSGEERRSENLEFKAVAFSPDLEEGTRKLNALAADGWEYVGQLKGEGLVAFRRRTDTAGAQKEVEKLQGHWNLIAAQANGEEFTDIKERSLSWEIEGDKITFDHGDKGTFTVNPTRKPNAIDVHRIFQNGREQPPFEKASAVLAIYSLEGDTLTICFEVTGVGRPKEFTTKAGLSVILYKLKRGKR